MKFSEQWLREWVNPEVSTDELCEQLTMAGLEVDALEPAAAAFNKVVIGEVLSCEPHPDADKLNVCQVNAGTDETLQIVCGASNVRAGLRVPAALVGAKLPGDLKIKKAKLRGVPSHGMLCSEKELGLADSAEGLMELPADAPVGEDIRNYLELDDFSIELGLTPNRSDCLGVVGIAREVGVLNRCEVTSPAAMEPVASSCDDSFPVSIEASEDCPRYVGRVIRGINPKAETPIWMVERLRRSGIRSLGPAVDITNYVLLELGQPMHAFDLGKLKDGIVVRKAQQGESLELLNGNTIELDGETLVIADQHGPLALAGIMGGEPSSVTDATTDIFLESAFFNPLSLAGRARAYGLHTDSSHRFERGVSPELQRLAIERATALFLNITGGEAGPVVEVADESQLPVRPAVPLRAKRVERVLGMAIPGDELVDILVRLGMEVNGSESEGWSVTPPAFRFDIAIEEDLIEEVGRIYGYNQLPSSRAQGGLNMRPQTEGRAPIQELRRMLVERGYQEAITYSFVDPDSQAIIYPDNTAIALANPISSEMSVMRTSLWPGLLQALKYNLNRQVDRVRLFETGLRFIRAGEETRQDPMLAGVICGAALDEQWGEKTRAIDFFDIKGDVEAILSPMDSLGTIKFVANQHHALHPGQSAEILQNDESIGWIGAIHPTIASKLGIKQRVYLFELSLEKILQRGVPTFAELSKFPAIRRDIALVADKTTAVDQVFAVIRKAAPEILRELKLFDLYEGEGIDSGRKSLALGLILQDDSRTLTDTEVDSAIEAILSALKQELGATLRD